MPSPDRLLHSLCGWQVSAALKGAVELDLFTAIAEGNTTTAQLSTRCDASERGLRILCDFLTVEGFLTKSGKSYGLPDDSAAFLNRNSPAFMGSAANFLASEHMMRGFTDVAATVRNGGSIIREDSGLDPEHGMWVEFARSMAPMMMLTAQLAADRLVSSGPAEHVLDIAAGHGLFGIAVAQRQPTARVVGLDWTNVLQVARENADRFGVADRYDTVAGSAFEVDLGGPNDVVLVPNFLHHFDAETNIAFLRRVHAALAEGGRVGVIEFVPNDDRVSPPFPAAFSFMMLGGTPSGDAYTFAELTSMLTIAGFSGIERHDLHPTPQTLVVGRR